MKNNRAQTIVLSRVNYGEADKIITALTSKGERLSLIAKGVRKPKSKLVAGAELFCISDICFVTGKGDMATLTSAYAVSQHTKFLNNLNKVSLAYEAISQVSKRIQDVEGAEYYSFLRDFMLMLESDLDVATCEAWMWLRLLIISGHGLRLDSQTDGGDFDEKAKYRFDLENGGFRATDSGKFDADHIKFTRIVSNHSSEILLRINGVEKYALELVSEIKKFAHSVS